MCNNYFLREDLTEITSKLMLRRQYLLTLPNLNVEQQFIFHAIILIWAKNQRKQAFLWLEMKMVLFFFTADITYPRAISLHLKILLFVAVVRLTDSRETAPNCPHKYYSQKVRNSIPGWFGWCFYCCHFMRTIINSIIKWLNFSHCPWFLFSQNGSEEE